MCVPILPHFHGFILKINCALCSLLYDYVLTLNRRQFYQNIKNETKIAQPLIKSKIWYATRKQAESNLSAILLFFFTHNLH